MADNDLFAVGDLAGEVEGGEVDAAEWAAGKGEYVGHAGAGRRADEAGVADLACYVDDDHGLTRRARGARRLIGTRRLIRAGPLAGARRLVRAG